MLEKLMNNPVAWLILSIITVISFAFGIYTWITGKRRKEISVSDISYVIIKAGKSQIPKLDVIYDGVNIDNLTVTQFYIWNSGNDVIDASDIVESKKLSIYSCNDTYILDAQILNLVEPSNEMCIASVTPDHVIIEFDYIDQGEGCLVQLLHAGDAKELNCDCKIKGGKKVRRCHEDGKKTVPVVSKIKSALNTVLEAVPMVLAILSGLFATAIGEAMELHNKQWTGVLFMWLIWLLVGFSFGFIFAFLQKKYNKTFHRVVPNELKRK